MTFIFFYIQCIFSFIFHFQKLTKIKYVGFPLDLSFLEFTKLIYLQVEICPEFREISDIISSNIFFFLILCFLPWTPACNDKLVDIALWLLRLYSFVFQPFFPWILSWNYFCLSLNSDLLFFSLKFVVIFI